MFRRTTLVLGVASLLSGACSCGKSALPSSEAVTAPAPAISGVEGDDTATVPAGSATAPPPGMAGTALLTEVDRELGHMTSSSYKHYTRVDEATGSFEYDCSGLLGYALSRAAPDAFAALSASAGRRPRSLEIVSFLESIPVGTVRGRWQRVGRAADLAPGDVIAWLKPPGSRSPNTGHTMIVHGAPSPDPSRSDAFIVPIVDATENPHVPGDARADAHRTGLGQGAIVLLVGSAGEPVGYRWSLGKRSGEKATTIALGRLR